MRAVTRLGPVVALAALAALLQPAAPPPSFAAHTPAQTGKQWTAGTATLGTQYWTHTNYWTCAAAICQQSIITPRRAGAQKGGPANRGEGGVSSCPDRETTGLPGLRPQRRRVALHRRKPHRHRPDALLDMHPRLRGDAQPAPRGRRRRRRALRRVGDTGPGVSGG